MKIGLIAMFLLLVTLPAWATTYYVSQSGGSVSCGADGTQTTQAYNWVNSSGHYTAGDTVKLCGTINGPNTIGGTIFTIQASGSSGNPITFFWESNASLSEQVCGTGNGNACIKTNNETYLVFDGNSTTNSIISTNNGSADTYGNQQPANGIWAIGCSNCEFKNLDIEHMYVMDENTDNAPAGFSWDPSGIVITGSNYLIHNNTITQTRSAIVGGLWGSANTNISIYNNTMTNVGGGVIYVGNTSAVLSNVFVYGNTIGNMNNWDNVSDNYHHDGIFFCNNSLAASTVTGIYIYNNLFNGDPGANMTAWIYFNSGIDGMYIWNNVLLNPTGRLSAGSNTLVEGGETGDKNYVIVNNFLDCNGPSTWQGIAIGSSGADNLRVQNNGIMRCGTPTSLSGSGTVITTPNDINSTTLGANSVGVPQSGSSLIHDGSTVYPNLASLETTSFTLGTDAAGNTRPATGTDNWDAGAYMYQSGTYTITVSSITGNGTVTSSDSVLNCTTGTTGTCTDSTASGTVTLTFTPSSGYTLSSVTGCTLSGNTCPVTTTATITATFVAIPTAPSPLLMTALSKLKKNFGWVLK